MQSILDFDPSRLAQATSGDKPAPQEDAAHMSDAFARQLLDLAPQGEAAQQTQTPVRSDILVEASSAHSLDPPAIPSEPESASVLPGTKTPETDRSETESPDIVAHDIVATSDALATPPSQNVNTPAPTAQPVPHPTDAQNRPLRPEAPKEAAAELNAVPTRAPSVEPDTPRSVAPATSAAHTGTAPELPERTQATPAAAPDAPTHPDQESVQQSGAPAVAPPQLPTTPASATPPANADVAAIPAPKRSTASSPISQPEATDQPVPTVAPSPVEISSLETSAPALTEETRAQDTPDQPAQTLPAQASTLPAGPPNKNNAPDLSITPSVTPASADTASPAPVAPTPAEPIASASSEPVAPAPDSAEAVQVRAPASETSEPAPHASLSAPAPADAASVTAPAADTSTRAMDISATSAATTAPAPSAAPASTPPTPTTTPAAPPAPPPPITAAPADIVRIVSERLATEGPADQNTVEIQLDPPELGRVSIDFRFEGQTLQQVTITAETPEAIRRLREMHFDLVQTLEQEGHTGQDMTFQQRDRSEQQATARLFQTGFSEESAATAETAPDPSHSPHPRPQGTGVNLKL